MTAVDAQPELVPLRTDFDIVWRGYEPGQVRRYVEETEVELGLVTADRDAAVSRADELAVLLEQSRAEVRRLREQVDRLSRTPVDPGTLPDRLRRMVDLAAAEAAEVTARAKAAADQHWASAEQAAARLRDRAERLVADLDTRRREQEVEHQRAMREAHERIAAMTREAEHRRRELDDRAATLREQVQSDFESAMRTRRAEAMARMSTEESVARARAARVVAEATEQAERVLAAARAQVEALQRQRARIAASLDSAHRLLAEAEPLLRADPPARQAGRGRVSLPCLSPGRTRCPRRRAPRRTTR